jgi:hypothetical protein
MVLQRRIPVKIIIANLTDFSINPMFLRLMIIELGRRLEAHHAIIELADVWRKLGMSPLVSLEVTLLREGLAALQTHMRLLGNMGFLMLPKLRLLDKPLVTGSTLIRLVIQVSLQMSVEMSLINESFATLRTIVVSQR